MEDSDLDKLIPVEDLENEIFVKNLENQIQHHDTEPKTPPKDLEEPIPPKVRYYELIFNGFIGGITYAVSVGFIFIHILMMGHIPNSQLILSAILSAFISSSTCDKQQSCYDV